MRPPGRHVCAPHVLQVGVDATQQSMPGSAGTRASACPLPPGILVRGPCCTAGVAQIAEPRAKLKFICQLKAVEDKQEQSKITRLGQ